MTITRRASFVLVVLLALTLTGVAQGQRTRHRGPIFAGLKSATTCIPGPMTVGETTSYYLQWEAATDREQDRLQRLPVHEARRRGLLNADLHDGRGRDLV
jgi:hypothetical protein